jgi:hypothetical protein
VAAELQETVEKGRGAAVLKVQRSWRIPLTGAELDAWREEREKAAELAVPLELLPASDSEDEEDLHQLVKRASLRGTIPTRWEPPTSGFQIRGPRYGAPLLPGSSTPTRGRSVSKLGFLASLHHDEEKMVRRSSILTRFEPPTCFYSQPLTSASHIRVCRWEVPFLPGLSPPTFVFQTTPPRF